MRELFIRSAVFVLLAGYGMVLVHNVLPHHHHEKHHDAAVHHGHHHDHDVHSNPASAHHHLEEDVNWLSFLMALAGDFGHTSTGHDHLEEYVPSQEVSPVFHLILPDIPDGIAQFTNHRQALNKEDISKPVERPPILYEACIGSADFLRGPPSLS